MAPAPRRAVPSRSPQDPGVCPLCLAARNGRVPARGEVALRDRAPVRLSPVERTDERRTTMLGFQPPAVGEEEIAAVAETLRSGWLTTGPRAAELERRMAEFLEAEHVLALASGTAALHLGLVALGAGPGDEVMPPPTS